MFVDACKAVVKANEEYVHRMVQELPYLRPLLDRYWKILLALAGRELKEGEFTLY